MGEFVSGSVYAEPHFGELSAEGLHCVDMHFHTRSSDSFVTVKGLTKLARKRGVGFAVTDHNVIGSVDEAFESAKDLLVIPGVEIDAWDGPHILVYFSHPDLLKDFFKKEIEPFMNRNKWLSINRFTEDILDASEGYDCVVSAAHPAGYAASVKGVQKAVDKGYLDPSVIKRFDAYESISGCASKNENLYAMECAKKYGLGITGGTDGHIKSLLGSAVTASYADNPEDFLEAVRKKATKVIGTSVSLSMYLATAAVFSARFTTCIPSTLSMTVRRLVWRMRQ